MAVGRSQPAGRPHLSGAERFVAAIAGEGRAFAPILWQRLPELVRQPQPNWWREPAAGQRLISDAAALAGSDAMFAFTAAEAVAGAAAEGRVGDGAIDELARGPDAQQGERLVATLHEVADHAVIAVLPAPRVLMRDLGGEEIEVSEDAFSDIALSYLQAGADALAVAGSERSEVGEGVLRAARMGRLFARPVLGLCLTGSGVSGWVHDGDPLGVLSEEGAWPAAGSGIVVTPGDVSGRWSADRLRAAGGARR
jgi:hypothetical protein